MVIDQRRDLPRLGTRKVHYLIKSGLRALHLKIGRDALFNFLRAEHMLIRPRKSYTKTTWSKHWLRKHPNLFKDTILTRPEQAWVSDITYIATKNGNAYLSLITDAYSRKIVGYNLSNDLRTEGVAQALRMAIRERQTTLPLIHHSDRGIQYCSEEYQSLLNHQNITPSMTDGYDCYQNALAERMNGILKDEFLLQTYQDQTQLDEVIRHSIQIYNSKRPHLKLGLKTPIFIHKKSLAELTTRDL